MLFNSFPFLFAFLPVVVLLAAIARRCSAHTVQIVLIAASLAYYALLDWNHLPVLLGALSGNYLLGNLLVRQMKRGKGTLGWCCAGIAFNLALLGGYKYLNVTSDLLGLALPDIIAPLGISFFTFHQLSYLIDLHRGRIVPTGLKDYILYATFFPHLIAGPIMRYDQFAPQLASLTSSRAWEPGLFLFAVGLFKKTVLADGFAPVVDRLFAQVGEGNLLSCWEAWKGALAYTWQIYFDFSGYADMAMGLGLLFGIVLPLNFAAPYKAASIGEFWHRWHISLSRFLRDYLYIPLGGSRLGRKRQIVALLVTMTLAGVWHGAALTFVAWGALHGLLLAGMHGWRWTFGRYFGIPSALSIPLTFGTVVMAWVLFRAEGFGSAIRYYQSMLTPSPLSLPQHWQALITEPVWMEWLHIGFGAVVVFGLRPAVEYVGLNLTDDQQPGPVRLWHGIVAGMLLWMSLKTMTLEPSRSFVYFVF
jgi:D-alanyl-lipoteichoic acid acyltransferase DltB (MBOAT superfamily)